MKKLFIGALFAVCLSGCATERVMTTGTSYPPTSPASVQLYQTQAPSKKFEEIGRVSVDKYNNLAIARSGDETYRLLREKAASIGGDGVMNITEDFASVSGVVIKLK
mgnify:CR=1 FL=1